MFKRTFIFAAALFGMLAFTPLPVAAQDEAEDLTEETSEATAKKISRKIFQKILLRGGFSELTAGFPTFGSKKLCIMIAILEHFFSRFSLTLSTQNSGKSENKNQITSTQIIN